MKWHFSLLILLWDFLYICVAMWFKVLKWQIIYALTNSICLFVDNKYTLRWTSDCVSSIWRGRWTANLWARVDLKTLKQESSVSVGGFLIYLYCLQRSRPTAKSLGASRSQYLKISINRNRVSACPDILYKNYRNQKSLFYEIWLIFFY